MRRSLVNGTITAMLPVVLMTGVPSVAYASDDQVASTEVASGEQADDTDGTDEDASGGIDLMPVLVGGGIALVSAAGIAYAVRRRRRRKWVAANSSAIVCMYGVNPNLKLDAPKPPPAEEPMSEDAIINRELTLLLAKEVEERMYDAITE